MINFNRCSTKRYNIASKLAVYAFFGLGLIVGTLFASNHCEAVSLSYERLSSGYPDGELGIAGSPDWTSSITVEPGDDYLIFVIKLADPYIATYFQGLTLDGDPIPRLVYDSTYLKEAWYIMEAPEVYTTTYYTLGADGSTGAGSFFIGFLDYYQLSDVSTYLSYAKTQGAGANLTYGINFTNNNYKYLLGLGDTSTITTVDGAVVVRSDNGSYAIASSTPGLNNSITINFSNSVSRASVLLAFQTYLNLGLNYPNFSTEPGLSWDDPHLCIYGEDCVIDFFYTNVDVREETALIEWIDLEDGSTMGTSILNMALPWTWYRLTVSSSTGDMIGDIDDFYVSISEDCGGICDVYWSSTGTIIWISSSSASTTYDLLPDCDTETVCPYISTSTTFFSVDNLACAISRAGCYLFKPSDDAISTLKVLVKQDAFGYMSTPGDIKDQFASWEDLTGPASTTLTLDMTNSLGHELVLLDSDDMQDLMTEELRERLFLIINICFAVGYLIGLFVEIYFLIIMKIL